MIDRIIIPFTLLIGCFFYGQNVVVKDSITQLPLASVVIKNIDNQNISVTNNLGQASFSGAVTDSITFTLDKYQVKQIAVSELSKTDKNIIYLKHKVFQLQSIITTGTSWKNNPKKSSAHIISLTEKEIQSLNQATTADLLNQTHEVYVQKSQLGGGSPMMRGFATNRLLINVDGVTMNNAIFRSGNVQNIIAIDPFSIQNMEVIAGPGSVLYGSDAIGGVISFETKSILTSEEFAFNGDISARFSTAANEKTIHADVDFSTPKWASYSSISYSDFGDLKMGKHGPQEYLRPHYARRINDEDIQLDNEDPRIQKYSGYQQKNFLQKVLFQPHQEINFLLSFNYSETSNVPRYDRLLRYRGDQLRSAEWYYGPQQWLLTNFKTEFKRANLLYDEFKSIISHQYFTESRHDRDFNSNLRNNRYERVNVWAWENSFIKKVAEKNDLLYGTEVILNHVNSSGNNENIQSGEKTEGPSRYPNGANWNQYGIYAKMNTELSREVNLKTGIRYSYVTSTSQFNSEFYPFPFDNADFKTGALTGAVGIYYKPFRQIAFNAQFTTGFRAPNIDDMGKIFDSEPGNVMVPNPELKPEYIYNIEAGVSKSFGNVLFLSALAYHSWLEDALVRRDFTLNGESTLIYDGELSRIQAMQNASKAKVYGGIVQMEFNLNKDLKLLGKINYTHGEEELDDGTTAPLRHAAPLFGNLGLTYEKNRFKTYLNYQFNGEVKAEDMPPSESKKTYLYALNQEGLPYAPSWHIINFSSQYKLTDYISLHFMMDNIFDQLYRPYSSGISAPGRNFVFSIRTIF